MIYSFRLEVLATPAQGRGDSGAEMRAGGGLVLVIAERVRDDNRTQVRGDSRTQGGGIAFPYCLPGLVPGKHYLPFIRSRTVPCSKPLVATLL